MSNQKATRRINKFNFNGEGAHVALVDSAANAQSVLVMKSAVASEEEIAKAMSKDVTVKMSIMEFLTRYLGLFVDEAEVVAGLLGYTAEDLYGAEEEPTSFIDMIQRQMDKVELQKAEQKPKLEEKLETFKSKFLQDSPSSVEKDDGENVKPTDDKEVVTKMSEENTEVSIEEQIQKAAERLMETQMEEVRKREEARDEEIAVLKAEQNAQRHAKFVAKAEKLKEQLGEDTDVEALAKALESAEASEEVSPLLKAVEALAHSSSNDELLDEIGKSASSEQPLDDENRIVELKKQYQGEGLDENKAYLRAYEEVKG